MKDLGALLGGGEPERKPTIISNGLDTIHITQYAFEKAYAYARLACKKAKGSIECGGYLIAPKDSGDRVATDSFLAKNQDVSSGLFTIKAEDVIKAGREINEKGYRVLGWWHSHGNLNTFFSQTDDNGQRTVLNEIGSFNYITQREEKEVKNLEVRIDDGRVVMFDRRSPERKYEIEVGNPGKLSIAKLKLQQERRIGFAYGLVVNNTRRKKERKPYAEIATRELCGFCRGSKDKSVPVEVTFFDTGEFEIDGDALMAEIKDRVKMEQTFFGFLKGGHRYEYPAKSGHSYVYPGGFSQNCTYPNAYPSKEEEEFKKYSVGKDVRMTRGIYKDKTGKISEQRRNYVVVVGDDGHQMFPFFDELELINPQLKENTSNDKKEVPEQKNSAENKPDGLLNDKQEKISIVEVKNDSQV